MRLERRDLLACATLALLGCCAFIHLMAVPVFEDEGTQLRWIDRADSSFGRTNLDQINLRQIALFDKPGSHARLAIYAVSRR